MRTVGRFKGLRKKTLFFEPLPLTGIESAKK
jgi:hypothetical protein